VLRHSPPPAWTTPEPCQFGSRRERASVKAVRRPRPGGAGP
jgi:hypothetical protein